MLAPHELKNTAFSKSLRGYSTVEVDEHIEFIIEKYTELYRLNDELEKKLRITEAQLDALKAEEESIKSTLVNAQKASTRIINEANERADVIMRSAKNSCDRMIAELQANVVKENERLREAQSETASFKAALFEAYRDHIGQIDVANAVTVRQNDIVLVTTGNKIGHTADDIAEHDTHQWHKHRILDLNPLDEEYECQCTRNRQGEGEQCPYPKTHGGEKDHGQGDAEQGRLDRGTCGGRYKFVHAKLLHDQSRHAHADAGAEDGEQTGDSCQQKDLQLHSAGKQRADMDFGGADEQGKHR